MNPFAAGIEMVAMSFLRLTVYFGNVLVVLLSDLRIFSLLPEREYCSRWS
jgi:hypothetical protein